MLFMSALRVITSAAKSVQLSIFVTLLSGIGERKTVVNSLRFSPVTIWNVSGVTSPAVFNFILACGAVALTVIGPSGWRT